MDWYVLFLSVVMILAGTATTLFAKYEYNTFINNRYMLVYVYFRYKLLLYVAKYCKLHMSTICLPCL